MKRVEVLRADEVEVKPFVLDDFIPHQVIYGNMKKITKKELKDLAEVLDLAYDDIQIVFAKKLLNAYMENLHGKKTG